MNKKNINEHIAQFLNYYVSLPDSRYAVMLAGSWGCGKTFFIKKWKEQLEGKIKNEKIKIANPIYVSLFGLSSLKELNEAITREVYPILKSKIYKRGKQALSAISKVTIKCDLPSIASSVSDGNPNEINLELDLVSLFKTDSNNVQKNRIIIFDDFERCKIDSVDMLGYINQFVEHSNIRIIILCYEDEVPNKKEYDKFKEKLVGRTFHIEPDTMSAIEDFCQEPGINQLKLDNNQQRKIRDVFNKVGHKNLRSLHQAIQDFSAVVERLEYQPEEKRQKDLFERFLVQYVVAYCEYPSNEEIREIASYEPSAMNLLNFNLFAGVQNEKQKAILEKYNNLPGLTPTNWIFDNPMSFILHSIVDGGDISGRLKAILHQKEIDESIDQRLSKFLIMENDIFDTTYAEAIAYILDVNADIITVIQTVSHLLAIDSRGIKPLEEEKLDDSQKNISSIIARCNDLKQFQLWKEVQFDRILTEVNNFHDNTRLRNYVNAVKVIVDKRIQELQQIELKGLELINNDNFDSVVKKYFLQIGSIETPKYFLSPLFDSLNPEIIAEALCSLNNENKMKFRNLLLYRYEIDHNVSFNKLFGNEIHNMEMIGKILQSKSQERKEIEKWAIKDLSESFQKCANIIKSDGLLYKINC